MTDKQIIIDGFNLEYIKKLLYNGQRSAITTNIFEAIIEELESKEQECERLSFDNFDLKDQLTDLKFKYKTINDVAKSFEQKLQAERKQLDQLKAELTRANCQIADDEILQCDMREAIEGLKAENDELKDKNNYSPEVLKQCPHYKDNNICTYLGYESKCEGNCNYTAFQDFIAEIDDLKDVNNKLQQQLDQLKAENDELKVMFKDLSYENQKFSYQIEEQTKQLEPFKVEYFKGLETIVIAELAKKSIRITAENRKLEQTLTEIKFWARELLKRTGQVVPNEIKQILQKISECEGNNEHS